MRRYILISFLGEGPTDNRFFQNIIQRLVENLLIIQEKEAIIQCSIIQKNGLTSEDIVYNAARQSKYSTLLILHSDADNFTVQEIIENKFKAGIKNVNNCNDNEVCKTIILLIPVVETETWMLIDKDLLREEINTQLSNEELGLIYKTGNIENINDPKQKIINAIQAHHLSLPVKRRRYAVTIRDLYEPMGQKINLEKLEALSAFTTFKENLIAALKGFEILT